MCHESEEREKSREEIESKGVSISAIRSSRSVREVDGKETELVSWLNTKSSKVNVVGEVMVKR